MTVPTTGSSEPESATDRTRQRLLSYSVKNMVYSMLAVLALAFVVWAIMPGETDQIQRRPVEVTSPAQYAQEQSGWPLWVAGGLGDGWIATYARYSTVAELPSWRIGWSTPEGEHAALDQTGDSGAGLTAWREALMGEQAAKVGQQRIDGPEGGAATWQVWEGPEGTSLLLPAREGTGEVTTVLHGTAGLGELTSLAEALRPLPE